VVFGSAASGFIDGKDDGYIAPATRLTVEEVSHHRALKKQAMKGMPSRAMHDPLRRKGFFMQEVHGVVAGPGCALRLFPSTAPPLSTFSLRLLHCVLPVAVPCRRGVVQLRGRKTSTAYFARSSVVRRSTAVGAADVCCVRVDV
jgi:hypothetical protein